MAKVWKDYPNTSTPITAAALNDLERRIDSAVDRSRQASEAVATGIAEIRRETSSKLDLSRIRTGSVAISAAPGTHTNGSISISPPMPSTNYDVILSVGSGGNGSGERCSVALMTDRKTTSSCGYRVYNGSRSTQPLTVTYIIITK